MSNGNGFPTKVFAELHRQKIGIRTLARRMDPEQPERARRNLNRWLHEGIKPSPVNRVAVAVALGVREDSYVDEDDEEEDVELQRALADLVRIVIARTREGVQA